MLNMFRMLIHPSSVACDLFVELFHGLYCSGTMCVGVTLLFGWGGVVSGFRLKHYSLLFWLLFHYLMLNMIRMLIHPSSRACDLFVELFHVLYCSGTICVGVTLWFGWGGVVSGFRLKHYSLLFWLLFHYLMLNMFRLLIHPSSVACDLFVE